MFDEPSDEPKEISSDPALRAGEKAESLRVHAELAAVFEGGRKFGAEILPGLKAEIAREVQLGIGKLEKLKTAATPVLPGEAVKAAEKLLVPSGELSTNDYHIHRRPGEVMIVRWLGGEEVETYYQRLQAHFDAAMEGLIEDERTAHEWQQNEKAMAYVKALEGIKINMEERYLREAIRKHKIFVLSTQTADELNINYLAEHIMGTGAEEIVGAVSAPLTEASEEDLAWFFKLFSLRGIVEGVERMCFFGYLQKTGE